MNRSIQRKLEFTMDEIQEALCMLLDAASQARPTDDDADAVKISWDGERIVMEWYTHEDYKIC